MPGPNYPIPDKPVYDPNIPSLADEDPASATQTFNPLIQRLINNIHAVRAGASDGNIDGGPFVQPDPPGPITGHNENESSHANMLVDGSVTAVNDSSVTLEEHMVNETAHGNIILDGNQS